MKPLVTIGIPTFNRPEMLARALGAVASQDYPHLEVIVADNAAETDEASPVVERFKSSLPKLKFVKHERNIGSLNNFFFLLRTANGKYFMWLADDDEISPNYVSSLVDLLEADIGAASATGHWVLMRDEQNGDLMPTSSYPQGSPLSRSLRFIWKSDDAFFYALHRTDLLRRATFKGYWWPNNAVFLNWAYVFLLDMVLGGRILLPTDRSVRFINHDYTHKAYAQARKPLTAGLMYVSRRVNVHYMYWEKCAKVVSPMAMPLVILTSLAAVVRDSVEFAVARLRRAPARTVAC
jgi:glycosyltransferase involved in cell wall biosynthesis